MPKAKEESLATIWAQKLKASGFEDCENTNLPDRPLKEWHGLKYSSEKTIQKIEIRREYQKLIDDFTNRKDFDEICQSIARHRNNKFNIEGIKDIWTYATQHGQTERDIAHIFGVSKTCIHGILVRLRKWMEII